MKIGLDFDNTIVRYDEVFLQAAKDRNLLSNQFSGNKQQVRNAIRLLENGELKWQSLQGFVYGQGIANAVSFDGVLHFLRRARSQGDTVVIVSHKTVYGHSDPDQVNLRQAAGQWMQAAGFFDAEVAGVDRSNVHFASTRADKIARIRDLNCDVFVDDLEEVLSDPTFPTYVRRILFSERVGLYGEFPFQVCESWAQIEKALYNGAH